MPWLYGIATNLLRNHARAQQRRLETLVKAAGRQTAESDHDGVGDAVAATAILAQTVAALAPLSDNARDVVVLVAVEGLSYAETAAALGVAEGTVRSRLSRARAELRRSLNLTLGLIDGSEPESQRGACHG